MRARPERLREVRGVHDLGRDDEQRIAVRDVEAIEVLGHRGVGAVGHAVPPQISRLHLRRHDFQRPSARGPGPKDAAGAHHAGRTVPAGGRHPLPVVARCARRAKGEQARLCAGVGLDLQRVVVLPGDVDSAGHAHDAAHAVRPALLAGCFVSRRIPGAGRLTARRVERHACDIAFRRRRHPIPPVLADDRHPVAREVDGGRRPSRLRRLRRAAALTRDVRHGDDAYDKGS